MNNRAGTHRPPGLWAAALFAIGVYNLLLGIGIVFKTDDLFDFGAFYTSAAGWWHGTDPYVVANLNPPHFSVLTAPLGALSPYAAWSAWQLLNLTAWLATLALAWRTRPAQVTLPVVAVLLAHASTSAQVHMGQVGWLLALPMTLSWLAFRRGTPIRSGLWLGLVLAVKPFLALAALPALFDRRWRVTWLTAGLTACGIGATGYALLGAPVYGGWAKWSGLAVEMSSQPLNAGLSSLAWLAGVTPIAGVALGIVGTIAMLPWWLRLSADRQWLAMLTMLVLSAPLGWMHYAAWTLPVLWATWPTLSPRPMMWALGLLCVPTVSLVFGLPPLRLVYPTGLLLVAWTALRAEGAASSSSPIINS